MRKIYDKNDFIRVVRELKKIRRDFDTVNQRCQQELNRLGFYFLEFMNPPFMSEVNEHSISVVNSAEYGTLLIYGMTPQVQSFGSGIKVRLYCIGVDIPEFHRKKTDDEIKAEEQDKENIKSKDDDSDSLYGKFKLSSKPKLKSKVTSTRSVFEGYFGSIDSPLSYDDGIGGEDVTSDLEETPTPERIVTAPSDQTQIRTTDSLADDDI